MSQELERDRGQRARRLLEDDLYQEAFTTVEAKLMSEWAASKPLDREVRETIFHQIGLLKALKAHLESVMRDGDFAAKSIEQKRKK